MLRTLFLIADPEDLPQLLAQSDPLERDDARGLDEEEVTPAVLAALATLVLEREVSRADVAGPSLCEAASGPSVHSLDASFVEALAVSEASELSALADGWRATAAVQDRGWAEDDVREILGALHALAKDAHDAGKRVLLWMAPLDD